MDTLFWGGVLRFTQSLLQASPTILIGLIVAGVFRRMLGHEGVRRLFGDSGWRSLPQAWAVGMLLPVCSLGVIPILREMRRAGVSGGVILAFGLTAPLFNPISVLYGLTLANPVVIFTFCLCSLAIVTVAGVAFDGLFPGTAKAESEPPKVAYGAKRMLAVAVFAARELLTPTSLYILLGLFGVTALSLVLPPGYLQMSAEASDSWAPLFMTMIAIPVYATPMTAMVQLASMFQHGNSVGAAFALLILGAGANLGLLAWLARSYGAGRATIWFAGVTAIVVLLAYSLDKPLYPHGVEPAGHTHAFDIYCSPFHATTPNPMELTFRKLWESAAPHELIALGALGVLLVAAIAMASFDPNRRLASWLEREPSQQRRLDVALSAPALGGIALMGLVLLSVLGCYLYYPSPSEIFEEMRMVNVEVVSSANSQHWDSALYWIPIYDDWTRKLQVSMVLRGESLSPYRRAKADLLRERLELLEHEVEDHEVQEAHDLGMQVDKAFRRMRAAYLPEK